MPPQNAVELVPTKSDSDTPKNGNLNNNNKDAALAKLDLNKVLEEPEPTKATIVIPPDGGFGWIVMVRITNSHLHLNSNILSFYNSLQVFVATSSSMVLCSVLACSLNRLLRI